MFLNKHTEMNLPFCLPCCFSIPFQEGDCCSAIRTSHRFNLLELLQDSLKYTAVDTNDDKQYCDWVACDNSSKIRSVVNQDVVAEDSRVPSVPSDKRSHTENKRIGPDSDSEN